MDYETTAGGILMPQQGLLVGGIFSGEHIRKGEVIDAWEDHNLVVNEGLNSLLGIMFHGDTQITTWYMGVFEGNYTPVATVTAATITAASTESTAYDEATRQAYDEAAAASQSITNSASRATFTFNATKTIYGTPKNVVDEDQLLLTYTFTASSS
jgi:hypothetical protein